MPAAPTTADPLAAFSEPTRTWFDEAFPAPTRAQRLAWPVIASGESTLLLGADGERERRWLRSLASLDRLMFAAVPLSVGGVSVVDATPSSGRTANSIRNRRADDASRTERPPKHRVTQETQEQGSHPLHLPAQGARGRHRPQPQGAGRRHARGREPRWASTHVRPVGRHPHGRHRPSERAPCGFSATRPTCSSRRPSRSTSCSRARAREILTEVETVIVDEIHVDGRPPSAASTCS